MSHVPTIDTHFSCGGGSGTTAWEFKIEGKAFLGPMALTMKVAQENVLHQDFFET